jgi:hypothetical protein
LLPPSTTERMSPAASSGAKGFTPFHTIWSWGIRATGSGTVFSTTRSSLGWGTSGRFGSTPPGRSPKNLVTSSRTTLGSKSPTMARVAFRGP